MIYLISPFSHQDKEVEKQRYEKALEFVQLRMYYHNENIFSPIVYGYHLQGMLKGDYLTWRPFNDEMILTSEKAYYLKLDAYLRSQGCAYEVVQFQKQNKDIIYFDDEYFQVSNLF